MKLEGNLRWGYQEAFCGEILKDFREFIGYKRANKILDNRFYFHDFRRPWFTKAKIHIKSQSLIREGL